MTETVANETGTDLPRFPAPRSPEDPFAPPPEVLALHGGPAVQRVRHWDGTTPWLAISHEAQRNLLSNPALSASIAMDGYPVTSVAMKAHAKEMLPGLNNTDGAEHTRWRRMLTNSFTRKRMALLRPEIQKITDGLIDDMLAGPNPVDLNTALSLPLPSLMICALLGVPYTDHEWFQARAGVTNSLTKTPEESARNSAEIHEYIHGLIEKKMADPQEDVLTDLGEKIREGVLEWDEAERLGLMLLVAGHDTSANMVTLGTALLLRNPDQAAALRDNADSEKFVVGAVEELLRYLTLPHLLARRAVAEDFEIEGITVRKGEGVIASLPAANWDPAVFPNPEKVDLTRRASHHHAFGWGPHQCVGQQLARIELQVVFSTLFRRIPTMYIAADFDSLRFKHDSQAYGIYELPIGW
jgi:cytochrome P450